MTTATNVSAGKPKVGGAIFAAPVGTPLPVSATEELNEAFESLGYCSNDGLTNSTSLETEKIKAWGGDTVLIINKSKDDTFKWKLIEAKSKRVLAFVYGDDNVSGTLETGLKVKVNSTDVPERSIVIDMILRGDTLKRIVIPSCKISEVGDIKYGDDNAIGYETTVDCTPDENGDAHIEYLQKIGSPSA